VVLSPRSGRQHIAPVRKPGVEIRKKIRARVAGERFRANTNILDYKIRITELNFYLTPFISNSLAKLVLWQLKKGKRTVTFRPIRAA